MKKRCKNYNDMSILVTGGLGFIGFNALQLWKRLRPRYKLVVIDSETYAAQFMLDSKKIWCEENGIKVVKGDIRDSSLVDDIVVRHKIDTIVNFAAESHVDNSIKNPNIFFETNVIGTVNLLNIAKKYDLRYHQIGTDEVHGITTPNDECYEGYKLDPSSPYSSSKCSADLIALSYFKTFGTRVTVSRCTNNFGKWQHTEKLIPTIISKILADEKVPVYGNGNQKRHWIYVDEHNKAVIDILENGKLGEVYNIAPSKKNYITNMQVIKIIAKHLKKDWKECIEHIQDRAAHDTSYFLYSHEHTSERMFKDDIGEVIDWYKDEAFREKDEEMTAETFFQTENSSNDHSDGSELEFQDDEYDEEFDEKSECFGVHVPLDVLSTIIGCEVPSHDRDPYGDFDTDEEAAEFGEQKRNVLENINWVFEKIPYAYNFEDFWIVFERGSYGDEPEDDRKYSKWLCELIIRKAGELSDEKCKAIRKLKFKKLSEKEKKQAGWTLEETQTVDDLDDYFTETGDDRHWSRDS